MLKSASLAIQQSKLTVTVRQEGAVLYISLPRITRERRENMANVASKKLLNEYKKALNEVNLNFLQFGISFTQRNSFCRCIDFLFHSSNHFGYSVL